MLGISVYFQDLDDAYIEGAAACGARYVFTSLQIPEEDYRSLPEKLPHLIELCQKHGLQLVPDISPVTFEKLGIHDHDFQALKEMGFRYLRLDYGLDDLDTIKNLMKDFHLMLNASVVDRAYLQKAKEAGILLTDIIVTHNFYPQVHTGLQEEYFIERNKVFLEYGMVIQAFVCGDDLPRFPLYEGLPTLEKHRKKHPYVASVELLHNFGIRDIMIGDSKAKLETLSYIQSYMKDHVMTIKAYFEHGYERFYETECAIRKDMAQDIIRLAMPRISDVAIDHNKARYAGAITMNNQLFQRYSGEVQLVKTELPMDARVNVIGFIHPEFIELLEYIDSHTTIRFIRM